MKSPIDFRYLAISDRSVCPEPVPRRAERLMELGVPAVQIRDKREPDRTRFRWLQSIEKPDGQRLLVNGRADLARLTNANGVHAPSSGLSVGMIRDLLADDALVGRSTHSRAEILKASTFDADYVTFGPVFPTKSKPGRDADSIPGLEELEKVCKLSSVPVLALGGISRPEQVRQCLDAGAYGVGGIRALFQPEDPEPVWHNLQSILEEAHP